MSQFKQKEVVFETPNNLWRVLLEHKINAWFTTLLGEDAIFICPVTKTSFFLSSQRIENYYFKNPPKTRHDLILYSNLMTPKGRQFLIKRIYAYHKALHTK